MSTGKPPRRRSPDRERVAQLVAESLTQPREATPDVLQHLLAQHEVPEGQAAAWLRGDLDRLEPYEQELILSPLFTPGEPIRLLLEEALGDSWLTAEEIEQVLEDLVRRDLELVLEIEGDVVGVRFPRVVMERFVGLLHLDTPLPADGDGEGDAGLSVRELSPRARRHLRDPTWTRASHRALLPELLVAARRAGGDLPTSVWFLTDFVRSHRPASLEDCRRYLADVAEAYEEDLRKYKSGERSFFDESLKAAHAGKWSVSDDVVTAHERSIALARALLAALEV